MWRIARFLILALALTGAGAVASQDVRSPVLTVDSDRLYRDSAFGKRVAREIETRGRAMAEENRALEAELETEERSLTAQRAELTPEEFRTLADAFDARVQTIRREREAQNRVLSELLEENRVRFLNAAAPVLEDIMREAGAGIVLERRGVFISANAIDITLVAIERIDASLGDGTRLPE